MQDLFLNIETILIAIGVHLVLSMIWYNKHVLGDDWQRAAHTHAAHEPRTRRIKVYFFIAIVLSAVLYDQITRLMGVSTFQEYLYASVLIGSFVAVAAFASHHFTHKSLKWWAIEYGYFMTDLVLKAGVFSWILL